MFWLVLLTHEANAYQGINIIMHGGPIISSPFGVLNALPTSNV